MYTSNQAIRTTFVVGKSNRKGTEMVVAATERTNPFPAPFRVRTVRRSSGSLALPSFASDLVH